ncbi:unnamed protein product [Phaedon cochleariae]|uniref:USP domain-containing protein n=1 Tax=Phaedon cochleariae TaxID=80249 RepID=A0A9N9SHV5_PHACE|nr:unnamed protein product [Phaedon cochleariae]
MEFAMFISGTDFDDLTTTTVYKCSQRKWNQKYKQWRIFKKGQWENYMSKLIWQTARLGCGFNFKNHYVNLDRNAGRFDGYCKCGSIMKCDFDEIPLSKNVMATVKVTLGSGKCGKRWLREPLRSTVCAALELKSVELYRAERADELMLPGDQEPPIIPSSNVLRTAKSQHIAREYLDPDPVKALVMMKYGGYSNLIQDIGLDPFFVQYSTNQQLQAYKSICAAGNVCVCLDSTGSVDEESFLELCSTTDEEHEKTQEEQEINDVEASKNKITSNLWTKWAESLNNSINLSIKEQGDRENAHFVAEQKLAKYLIKDLTLYPMWSCVCNKTFGLPDGKTASSAPIEGEFNKLKNVIFAKRELPLRVDRFVRRHLDYLSGKMKLVDVKIEEHTLRNSSNINIINTQLEEPREEPVANNILKDLDSFQNIINEDPVIDQVSISDKNSPMCGDCDLPISGTHECIVCGRKVHITESCSKSVSNGNLRTLRVCNLCFEGGNLKQVLDLREFENWRNKGEENNNIQQRQNRKRKSLYLGNNKTAIKDKISHEKHASIPMLKNANSMDLASIKVDGKKVTLTNTCAFDSIFHLLLTATYDFETMCQKVGEQVEEVGIFKLIQDVCRNGVTNKTYKMRANILRELHSIKPHPNISDLYLMDCETNVGTLSRGLLKNVPSFEEISLCDKGCQPRIKYFPAFSISRRNLLCDDRENLINNCISLNHFSDCPNTNCDGRVKSNLVTGDIVVFDVDTFKMFRKIKLESLPLSINIPDEDNVHLKLVGIVNYRGSAKNDYMGHYTAISYRRADRCWVEYDDLIGSSRRLTANTLVQPALTIMLKIKK